MAGGQAEGSSMRTLKPVGKKAGARMERKAWGPLVWELQTSQ